MGDAIESNDLSRCDFLLVFLGATGLGGIEETLRRPRRFRMENRADGRVGISEIDRASGMVLSAQRNDDALAVHAQGRMVRAESPGMSGAESDRGGSARSWGDRRSRPDGAGERDRT